MNTRRTKIKESIRKTQNFGVLKFNKKNISIQTSEVWKELEIDFVGDIKIKSLLPDDYIVRSGINKIIIVKFNKRDEILSDLIEYKGKINITKCIMASGDMKSKNIYIDKSSLQFWNTLGFSVDKSKNITLKDWAYLGENWEDLDGNNDKNYYTYRKKIYDKESKTYTEIKERKAL